jgi:hypothetical protein
MAPILRFVTSSGSKKKDPRNACLSETRASHSHRMWTGPAQPYYRQIRPIVHIGDIWLHCAPEALYCLHDPLTHCSYLQNCVTRSVCSLTLVTYVPIWRTSSLKSLNIGVNELSGSHHQSTTRHKRLFRSLWSTTTVNLQRPRTFSIEGGCGFLPWRFLVTISTVRQPFVTAVARAFLRCCKPTGLKERRHDTLTAFSAKRCNSYSALCQKQLFLRSYHHPDCRENARLSVHAVISGLF